MKLIKLSVRRPVTTIMITLIAVILGLVSLIKLPVDLLPKIEVPVAIVSTSYKGVGPREIEKLITIPVEEAVATVRGIENIRSVSNEESSIVIAEFKFGTDMDFAALDMREKVDMVRGFMPKDASKPMVVRIDPNSMPIIEAALYGEVDLYELQKFAEDVIKPRLERIEGVGSVSISGGYLNHVEIELVDEKVKGYGLQIEYISRIIQAENINLPGGSVEKGNKNIFIRTVGEFESIDDIKKLPIPLPRGGTVLLEDISNVNLKFKEVSSIARINGKESIDLSIQKQSGTNTVKVAEEVNKEFKEIEKEFPDRKINKMFDQSNYIKYSISNVFDNILYGSIFAIIVLFLFFRNVKSTLIISISIPVSIIVCFSLLYFNNITLNLMTLGGLALGIGMLVDNSIVVLENIFRFRQEGYSLLDASIKGASEVSLAVTASTLTTIAVFLPIVFVEGLTSTLFKELALTVSLSLIASLIVAITLIPMLSSKLLSIQNNKVNKKMSNKFNTFFEKIINVYKKLLYWSLHHRGITVIIGILIFVVSIVAVLSVGAEFFPEMDEGQFMISVRLPSGTELETTERVVSQVEEVLEGIDEVETVSSNIGGNGMFITSVGSTDKATINVAVKKIEERDRSTSLIADEVRNKLKDIPGAKIKVEVISLVTMGGGLGGESVSIKVKGDDFEELKKIGDEFVKLVSSVEGTREVKSNYSIGIPELQIDIDRLNSSKYGLTAVQIGSAVRNSIRGIISTRYRYDGDVIDVIIKGDKDFSSNVSNLRNIEIDTPIGTKVQLEQVADISTKRGPSAIRRDGQSRVVTITGQIVNRDLNSISKDIEEELIKYEMPKGYIYEIGGQNKELNEAFSELTLAIILAILLVYMVLASQFESLLHPFTIMISVPLAFAGGALGLYFTGKTLSIPALIGAMMLAGIVVNDSIVLIDYINILRRRGEERLSAIIKAGPIRLRPILITTLTTVLALIPLALGIGEGAEVMAPMAIVVIGGLSLATLLTLIFIPVVYTIFDDISLFFKRPIRK